MGRSKGGRDRRPTVLHVARRSLHLDAYGDASRGHRVRECTHRRPLVRVLWNRQYLKSPGNVAGLPSSAPPLGLFVWLIRHFEAPASCCWTCSIMLTRLEHFDTPERMSERFRYKVGLIVQLSICETRANYKSVAFNGQQAILKLLRLLLHSTLQCASC